MTYKEIQQAVAGIINDNIKLGKHGQGLAELAKNAEVPATSLRTIFDGEGNSLKTFCKVLDALGYGFTIVEYDPEPDIVWGKNRGVRINCGKCGFSSRYKKAKIFLENGWTMSRDGVPLCPCCSERYRQEKEFRCYFAKMKELQEL